MEVCEILNMPGKAPSFHLEFPAQGEINHEHIFIRSQSQGTNENESTIHHASTSSGYVNEPRQQTYRGLDKTMLPGDSNKYKIENGIKMNYKVKSVIKLEQKAAPKHANIEFFSGSAFFDDNEIYSKIKESFDNLFTRSSQPMDIDSICKPNLFKRNHSAEITHVNYPLETKCANSPRMPVGFEDQKISRSESSTNELKKLEIIKNNCSIKISNKAYSLTTSIQNILSVSNSLETLQTLENEHSEMSGKTDFDTSMIIDFQSSNSCIKSDSVAPNKFENLITLENVCDITMADKAIDTIMPGNGESLKTYPYLANSATSDEFEKLRIKSENDGVYTSPFLRDILLLTTIHEKVNTPDNNYDIPMGNNINSLRNHFQIGPPMPNKLEKLGLQERNNCNEIIDDPNSSMSHFQESKTMPNTLKELKTLKNEYCFAMTAYVQALLSYLNNLQTPGDRENLRYFNDIAKSDTVEENKFNTNGDVLANIKHKDFEDNINAKCGVIGSANQEWSLLFNDKNLIVNSNNTKSPETHSFSCSDCDYSASTIRQMKIHTKAKHDKMGFCCSDCDFTAPRVVALQRHKVHVHKHTRLFACPECDYKAITEADLKIHKIAKHCVEKPFRCPHCEHSLSSARTLKIHIHAKHSSLLPFTCSQCDYSTVISSNLRRHINIKHSKTPEFRCSVCDFATFTAYNLKHHKIAKHSEKRPFPCPHCDYSAAVISNLNFHMVRKHKKKKPFPCPDCDYGGAIKRDLELHRLSKHSGLRPFPCSECNYAATRASVLRYHMNAKHSGKTKKKQEALPLS